MASHLQTTPRRTDLLADGSVKRFRGHPDLADEGPAAVTEPTGTDQTKPDSVVAQEAAPLTGEAQAAPGQVATTEALPEVIDVRQGMFGARDAWSRSHCC